MHHHFSLSHDPFLPPRSPSEVYVNRGIEQVLHRITRGAQAGEMLAIVGPAGCGKTLICDKALDMLPHIHTIRTHAISRNRTTGSHILDAIIEDIGGKVVYGSMERRARMVREMLLNSHARNRFAALVIDDAHECPTSTLQDIKRIHELCGAFVRPLAIVLAGRPTLMHRLSSEAGLSGLGERVNPLQVPAVDPHDYLSFKLQLAGGELGAVFTPDAAEVITRGRTTPLQIEVSAYQAMMLAAGIGEDVVSSEVVKQAEAA